MKSLESVVVVCDGESKCGKTTLIEGIAEEAAFQASVIPGVLEEDSPWADILSDDLKDSLTFMQDRWTFKNIQTVSAGNMFRAASLYLSLLELGGQIKTEFVPEDVDPLREILAISGIIDVLQEDPNIGTRVSHVGAMAGVQALCGTLFCDYIQEACKADGGSNLVIVDARDPIGHLQRNNRIGGGVRQIQPRAILPIYIDTTAEVAASRMSGDYSKNLAVVRERRHIDATRAELPVSRPEVLIRDLGEWGLQLSAPEARTEVIAPFRFDNNANVTLDNIQWLAGYIAAKAQDTGLVLHAERV